MTTPILPPIPPTPNEDSPAAAWDVYLRAIGEHNRVAMIEATSRHAAAQQATADGLQAYAVAQQNTANAIAESGDGGGFDKEFVKWLVSTVMRLPPESP